MVSARKRPEPQLCGGVVVWAQERRMAMMANVPVNAPAPGALGHAAPARLVYACVKLSLAALLGVVAG